MAENHKDQSNFILYTSPTGEVNVEVNIQDETVWLTLNAIASLFNSSKQNISYHFNNLFKEDELDKSSTVKEFLTVQKGGGKEVTQNLEYYNLEAIISVGYRVNSAEASIPSCS